jgi:mRNA-degrading endonuclease RelE of RelBE toxin-antitoxin system
MSKGRKKPLASPPVARSDEPQAASCFELRYTEDAGGDIQGLDGRVKQKLRKVLEKKLAVDPEGYGLPLRGPLVNYWKHEFANHRIIYRFYSDQKIVAVCAVGPRKAGDAEDVYNQLDSLIKTGRLAEQVASVLKKILPKRK